MEKDEIIIRNAVMHILNTNVGQPVISEALLELSPDLNDFLRAHIFKIMAGDDKKECTFDKESYILGCLTGFNESMLLSVSQNMARSLYGIMISNADIPQADLFVVTFQRESVLYLAILKMNYKEFYIHTTDNSGDWNVTDIVKQKTALPNEGTKLTEAAIINLEDMTIQVIEKKYDINGVKANYFSGMFLQCSSKISEKVKLAVITRAVDQINLIYFDNDFDKKMKAKEFIHEKILESGSINLEDMAQELFGDMPEVRVSFQERLEKYDIKEIKPQNKQTLKKYDIQSLLTDTGIGINIPMDVYKNSQKFEINTNSDGMVTILIKGVTQILVN